MAGGDAKSKNWPPPFSALLAIYFCIHLKGLNLCQTLENQRYSTS